VRVRVMPIGHNSCFVRTLICQKKVHVYQKQNARTERTEHELHRIIGTNCTGSSVKESKRERKKKSQKMDSDRIHIERRRKKQQQQQQQKKKQRGDEEPLLK